MTKQNHLEIDAVTGEEIVVELTAKEIADRAKLAEANQAALAADELAKATAKATILDRLGLTAAEAKLLIS